MIKFNKPLLGVVLLLLILLTMGLSAQAQSGDQPSSEQAVQAPNAGCDVLFNTYNVKLNGQSGRFPSAVVQPGQTVSVELPYTLANSQSCPGCIRQIVIGVENTAKYCAYNGIPTACYNGTTGGTNTTSFTAPTSPGQYLVYAHDYAEYNCTNALSLYPNVPYRNYAEAIGQIIVR